MPDPTEWSSTFQHEIRQARTARLAGNEGKARVCARRAAGAVAGEYLRQRGAPTNDPSAYTRLQVLASLPGLSTLTQEAIAHLLLRVTPEYRLPVEADLIADACWLAQNLLNFECAE